MGPGTRANRPAIADSQPIHLGWGNVSGVIIQLNDPLEVPWYWRFTWPAHTDQSRY